MTWEFEQVAYQNAFHAVCGVDEAGRGPLAGPVCAAAVILLPEVSIIGLNDSKKLTPKKRDWLYDVIIENAVAYSIAFVDEKTIDDINILQASMLAMQRAVEGLAQPADFALVDGNAAPALAIPTQTVVKGDAKVPSIAAASVLAKVARDRLMMEYDAAYPEYGFAKHKGYPTRLHYEMLDMHGICPIHRMTFLRKYLRRDEP